MLKVSEIETASRQRLAREIELLELNESALSFTGRAFLNTIRDELARRADIAQSDREYIKESRYDQ